jgi:hypothetical protein
MLQDRESRISSLAARLYLGTARDDELTQFLQPPTDWDRLLHEASKEGVAGLLAQQLQRLTLAYDLELPIASFSEALRYTFARNGNHRAALMRLRRVFKEENIPVILLKGAALIETSYGGQMGLRPLSDVDLLIKPSDVPTIHQALESMDFRRSNPLSTFYTNGSAAFDLHTDLVGASRIRRRADAVLFDMDDVWAKALPLDDRDDRLLVLDPAFQFLHLAVHGLKHSFSRLIWLVDLALVGKQQPSWDALFTLARETKTLRPLTYALLILERCLAFEVPKEARGNLVQLNRAETIFLGLVQSRRPSMHVLGEPILAFSIPSLTGKLGYLAEYLFPRRRTLSHDSSSTPSWLLYPRRLEQIVKRGFSYLRMALRSLRAGAPPH